MNYKSGEEVKEGDTVQWVSHGPMGYLMNKGAVVAPVYAFSNIYGCYPNWLEDELTVGKVTNLPRRIMEESSFDRILVKVEKTGHEARSQRQPIEYAFGEEVKVISIIGWVKKTKPVLKAPIVGSVEKVNH